MQHELAIQYHDSHADKGEECSTQLGFGESLLIGNAEKQSGEKRAAAYDERCVCRCCVFKGHVLREEVQASARKSERRHEKFVPDIVAHQFLWRDENQYDVCYGKA